MALMNFTPEGVLVKEKITVSGSAPVRLGHALFLPKDFVIQKGDDVLVYGRDYVFDRIDQRLYRSKGMVCFTAIQILSAKYRNVELTAAYYAVGDYINAEVFNDYYAAEQVDAKLSEKVDVTYFEEEKAAIHQAIADETEKRQSADLELQNAVEAEAISRQDADNRLQDSVIQELQERKDADVQLQEAIDTAVTGLSQTIADLDGRKIERVELESGTGIFKFILGGYDFDQPEDSEVNQGKFFKIDTLLEKIAVNFRYDEETNELVVVLNDGSEQRVQLSEAVDMSRISALEEAITYRVTCDRPTGGRAIHIGTANDLPTSGIVGDMRIKVNYLYGSVNFEGFYIRSNSGWIPITLNGIVSAAQDGDILTLVFADGTAQEVNLTGVTVDASLSFTSTNPVQNKVITKALDGKADYGHTHGGIYNWTALDYLSSKIKYDSTRNEYYFTFNKFDSGYNRYWF